MIQELYLIRTDHESAICVVHWGDFNDVLKSTSRYIKLRTKYLIIQDCIIRNKTAATGSVVIQSFS